MKRVLIIYTGGTIGMTRTENGYAPRAGYFRAALDAIPDLRAPEMPEWEFYELSPLLDSSNMTVREWNCIAELIAQKYDDYDGFVVLHGTDTMAYTASALSFMLDGLDKPVVLTGSQIPLCEIRSDGRDNLITALLIAGEGIVRETCLYFGGKLLRGNRATKYSADGLIAFVSPNYPSLAEAGISIKYNEAALLPRQEGGLKLQTLDNIPIGVIKVFPGIQFSLFEAIMTEKLRGIVIETFGAGNIPGDGNALLPIIRKAFQNGTVLTVCSQCPQGAVSLGTYETSSALKKAGAVSGLDMTTEAAVAKLYYLFSLNLGKEEIKRAMEQDFMATIGARVSKKIKVTLVYQDMDDLPEGYTLPDMLLGDIWFYDNPAGTWLLAAARDPEQSYNYTHIAVLGLEGGVSLERRSADGVKERYITWLDDDRFIISCSNDDGQYGMTGSWFYVYDLSEENNSGE